MWRKFWGGLNIRKCISLCFTITFCVVVIMVVNYGITSANTDVLLAGVAGLSSILSSCIGYYFGYSNGLSSKVEKSEDITDSL